MSASFPSGDGVTYLCQAAAPPPNGCQDLLRQILEMIFRDKRSEGGGGTHGLVHRFDEQIHGRNGPGTSSWQTHEQTIRDQQKGLRDRLKKYQDDGCGDPPPNAWSWATRPVPKAKEWVGPRPANSPIVISAQDAEVLQTAGKVGAGLGIGYLIYRGVRMIPSLFPPAWWTIPGNLAIP